jgi:hypothetical protein
MGIMPAMPDKSVETAATAAVSGATVPMRLTPRMRERERFDREMERLGGYRGR